MRRLPAQRHHARHVLLLLLILLFVQPGGSLDRQGMHRQAVRIQRADHIQRVCEHPVILARQRGDYIHVDVVKAQRPCQMITVNRLLRGVRAADHAERLVIHGLRVDADARHRMAAQHGKLLPVERIRPAGFHRQLGQRAKTALHMLKQAVKLRGRQAAGRAAANVADVDVQAHVPGHFAAQVDLVKQRAQVRLNQPAVADLTGGKRAVRAARRAERDADVQIAGVLRPPDQPLLRGDDLIQQVELFLRQVKERCQRGSRLSAAPAALQLLIVQARRADTRERAPCGAAARHLFEQTVTAALDQPLELALFLQTSARHRLAAQGHKRAGRTIAERKAFHPFAVLQRMGMFEHRVVRFLRRDCCPFTVEQTHDVRDVVAKALKRRYNRDSHAKLPRSQAIFVFMP